MNNIILQQISSTELVEEIKESILKELKKVLGMAIATSNKKEELLSNKDVCEHFHIHQSTLYRWVKKGKIIRHYLGNKVYYKRSELPLL
ncbi:helix-turn-helix domain-containing protein [Chryseobacterium sp.]|uniref:helix-turn-helix domain-containing protein n=1 Tax=Chryseobacterium sp. TaxID=1871047 RepID=UPI0028A2CF7B|nr:helix-turn-helix domain-containing protein [Chryseobacterium sp.]